MEIRQSAYKHGVTNTAIAHAVEHWLLWNDDVDGSEPPKILVLGPDRAGNILEILAVADRRMSRRDKNSRDVTMPTGQVLTDAEFEQMAHDAESDVFDTAHLESTSVRRGGGRPPLGNGPSNVLQVRLDEVTRGRLAERAAHDRRTPSSVARDAIRAWLDAS